MLAKLALSDEPSNPLVPLYASVLPLDAPVWAAYAVRAPVIGAMVLANVLQFALAARAMQHGGGATQATVTNLGFSFVSVGVLGWAVFGEPLGLRWWGGAAMVLAGLGVIQSAEAEVEAEGRRKKNKAE